MASEVKLKPCPCCGGHATMEHGAERPDNGWVVCMGCGLSTRYHDDPAEAAAEWNRREAVTPCNRNGNAAAMREALYDIVMLTMKVGYSIHGDVACGIIASKAKHALSAPQRNCDVGTAEEQTERYNKYCYDHRSYEMCCGGCPLNGEPCCELAWAHAPYEAQEGAGE